uniref:Alpha-tubulin N-acetyltransferase n=1 Tax=Glossina austeni TaxID=7395 RepID=A0A1A9V3N8_GLOAU
MIRGLMAKNGFLKLRQSKYGLRERPPTISNDPGSVQESGQNDNDADRAFSISAQSIRNCKPGEGAIDEQCVRLKVNEKMVDFRFDIKPLFTRPIIKVTSNLLPHTFRGDRRQSLDATAKMSEIIDSLGLLSAKAQKLTKPVTTAQRLRSSENQVVYILADVDKGVVLGLLKVGTKDLYLFDEIGQTRKIPNAPSILDFYIHESRQRSGLGKELFETMLSDEGWKPIKCSVDRPSDKLLGFLRKHYGLVRTIPQANNFVLYEGFFDDKQQPENQDQNQNHQHNRKSQQQSNGTAGMHLTNSPNTQLFGATYLGDELNKKRSRQSEASKLSAQITQIAPVGRYGARRPTCSMAEVFNQIH